MISEITSKMRINRSANEVFEALVDPEKIGNYWFSSGSSRLEEGKKITWIYQEYNAELTIKVVEVEQDKRIVYKWGR